MICSKCSSEIPEGSEFCNKCGIKITHETTTETEIIPLEIESKDNKVSEENTITKKRISKRTIIIIASCLLIGISIMLGKHVQMENRLTEFHNKLLDEIENDMLLGTTYKLESRPDNYKDLVITFPDDFDNKTPEERANILGDIMQKFRKKRSTLLLDYDLNIRGLVFITAKTQTKTYTYNDIDKFKDADGKEIDLYDKYHGKNNSNSSTTNSASSTYSTPKEPSNDNKAFAWTAALNVVKENLKAPSTAKFPYSYAGADIKEIGYNTFKVNSYVDAENSFGAKIRNNFSVTIIKKNENSYTYKDLNISN